MFFHIVAACILLVILALRGVGLAETPPESLENKLVEVLQPDRQICFRLTRGHSLLPSTFLEPQFDCELRLPIEDSQFKLSYAQQIRYGRNEANLKDLSRYLGDETNNLMRSFGTFALLEKQLKAEIEVSYSYATPHGQPEPYGKKGMAGRLSLKGEWDSMKYWGEYGFFGKEFTNRWASTPQDRAGANFGAELNLGILKPRVELARFYNNVDEDPNKSQTVTPKGKVSLDLRIPHWPILNLTYRREQKETASNPSGTLQNEVSTETVSGTLWYGRSVWESYVTSSYSLNQDQLTTGSNTVVYDYVLGGYYHPINVLSINPNIELTQVLDRPRNVRAETFSNNLGLYYSILEGSLFLSLYGSLITDHASDGYVDTERLDSSLGLVKNLSDILGLPHHKQSLSFRLDYSRYIDMVYQAGNWEAYSVLLLLEIIP